VKWWLPELWVTLRMWCAMWWLAVLMAVIGEDIDK